MTVKMVCRFVGFLKSLGCLGSSVDRTGTQTHLLIGCKQSICGYLGVNSENDKFMRANTARNETTSSGVSKGVSRKRHERCHARLEHINLPRKGIVLSIVHRAWER